MKTSPCQRSLKELRRDGWLCAITERWNPFAKIRQDLYGFIDILCLKGDIVMAVQTTSGDHVAERIQKIQALDAARVWLTSPNRHIVVHGWRQIGPRGEKKVWRCRQIQVFMSHSVDLADPATELGAIEGGLFKKAVPF